MKNFVHARLNSNDMKLLADLRKKNGETVSELVKKGLRLLYARASKPFKKTALELCKTSVGKFSFRVSDLSTNKIHLEGYGK